MEFRSFILYFFSPTATKVMLLSQNNTYIEKDTLFKALQ